MRSNYFAIGLVLLTFLLIGDTTNAQLSAQFTADRTFIQQYETVQFTDTSRGSPDWWEWEFPGGTPRYSEEQNPRVTYDRTGVFTVRLTIWRGWSQPRRVVKRRYIEVEPSLPSISSIRVPAEWEPQEGTWLQWPTSFERVYEPSFAKISNVIVEYQALHILYDNNNIRRNARTAIRRAGGNPDHRNIRWHRVGNDNAWMRDNGPVYVIQDGELRIQNWDFDAWGGGFGNDVRFFKDTNVPIAVGSLLGNMPVDKVDIVHERGNLEFNGKDAVILNWSTIGDPNRNPGYTKQQAKADMKRYFGVDKVILIEGIPQGDLTRGHVDGIARFIDEKRVVVPRCTRKSKCQPGDGLDDTVYNNAAKVIAKAGFDVIRMPIIGTGKYNGQEFDAEYMNWLVGNGFVIAVGFNNPVTDGDAKRKLESYFPGRDVHIIEMLASWSAGGGVHCHTNDQPAFSLVDI